jgi:hypothetical protein
MSKLILNPTDEQFRQAIKEQHGISIPSGNGTIKKVTGMSVPQSINPSAPTSSGREHSGYVVSRQKSNQ